MTPLSRTRYDTRVFQQAINMVTGDNIYETFQRIIQEKLGNATVTVTLQRGVGIFFRLAKP